MNQVFSADNHHEVLPFWSRFRKTCGEPAVVLTLDHHTDVVRAFRDENRRVPSAAWRDENIVIQAVKELRHDEHFDWALRADVIQEAFIASHTCATHPADPRLHVLCDSRWPEENQLFRAPELFRPLADSVLESEYLYRQFGELEQYGRFILDIDCDYILTEKALYPQDPAYLRQLFQRAALVTVSLEKDWVRLLKLPGETITSEEIFRHFSLFADGVL